jgi:hypothetical protein
MRNSVPYRRVLFCSIGACITSDPLARLESKPEPLLALTGASRHGVNSQGALKVGYYYPSGVCRLTQDIGNEIQTDSLEVLIKLVFLDGPSAH